MLERRGVFAIVFQRLAHREIEVMAIFGLAQMNSLYTAVMFGYLAYQNFQQMKQNSWS